MGRPALSHPPTTYTGHVWELGSRRHPGKVALSRTLKSQDEDGANTNNGLQRADSDEHKHLARISLIPTATPGGGESPTVE